MLLTLIVLYVLPIAVANQNAARLYDDLLVNYDKLPRPVRNSSCAMKIIFKMKLTQIADVHEKDQVVTINGYLIHVWHDYRLAWDRASYGGLQVVHIPTQLIWLPDIILYNNAHGSPQVTTMTKAHVYYTGQISWEPPVIYSFMCSINIEWFPYDEQHCELKFGSWTYYGNDVDLIQPLTDKVEERKIYNEQTEKNDTSWVVDLGADITEYQESGEWDLMSVSSNRHVRWYPCCEYPYIDITYKLHIRRKTLFYSINLVTPCVGITILTCIVFYLPSDSNSKITLCVSILVTLTVFFLLLVELIPPTSLTIPLIGRYLLFTMCMVTLSITCTIMVLNIHYRMSIQPLPRWVRFLLVECLPRLLFIKRPLQIDQLEDNYKSLTAHMVQNSVMAQGAPVLLKKKSSKVTFAAPKRDAQTQMLLNYVQKACIDVQYIAETMRQQRKIRIIKDDWKFAAIVADRVFLLLFSATCLFGTIWIIIRAPSLSDTRQPITLKLDDQVGGTDFTGLNKTIDLKDPCNWDLLLAIAMRSSSFVMKYKNVDIDG